MATNETPNIYETLKKQALDYQAGFSSDVNIRLLADILTKNFFSVNATTKRREPCNSHYEQR